MVAVCFEAQRCVYRRCCSPLAASSVALIRCALARAGLMAAANSRCSQLCVVRRKEKDQKFPPSAITHRGGALPLQHLAFFTAGKKYRVPMFLATSFNEMTAYGFWYDLLTHLPAPCPPPPSRAALSMPILSSCTRYRKFDEGQTPVHWVIHLDPAGQHNLMKRCKHVNLVSGSNVDGEEEFLFAPCVRWPCALQLVLCSRCATLIPPSPPCRYSVFTVISVHVPPRPTDADPILIHIMAAIDNRRALVY